MSDHLYKDGLRGQSTGQTAISTVGQEGCGLSYYGYDITQLAEHATFEEIAYLLLRGRLPTMVQLDAYIANLKLHRDLPQNLKSTLQNIPAQAHPMDVMRTGCSMLGVLEPEGNFNQQTLIADRLLAVLPSIMCYWYRFSREGIKINTATDDDSIASHILHMLHDQKPNALLQRAMDVSLMLYAEHEFNASTFTARICASTLSDFYSAVCAAIGSLKGPLHGGANEAALKLIQHYSTPEQATAGVRRKLQQHEKIMGFGHAVYQTNDPRSPLIKLWSQKLSLQAKDARYFQIAEAIEKFMWDEKKLFANLDFYSATAFHFLSIPVSLFTPIFVCSRTAGWAAHIFEQRANNVLIRPRAEYIGPAVRQFVAIEERN